MDKPIRQLKTDIRRLGRGASIVLIGRMGGRILLLLNQVIVARLLGPSDFGLYALGWTTLQIGSLIAPMGLHQGVIRYGSKYWQKDDKIFGAVLRQSLLLALFFSGLVALALFVGAPSLTSYIFKNQALEWIFRGFAIALAFASVLKVTAAATRIIQRMTLSVLAEDLTPTAVQLVFVFLFVVLLDWGVRGAVLSVILGLIFASSLAVFFVWQLFGTKIRQSRSVSFSVRELLTFSLTASLAGIFAMLTMQIDRLLVGYFLSSSKIGIYQAASQVAMLFTIILSSFNTIFAPMIARLYYDGELKQLDELFKVSTKWALYISLPFFLIIVVAPREVMFLVFGKAYVSGAVPMLIMASAQLFNVATGAVGFLLIMSGYQMRWLSLSLLSFAINIGLGVLLISFFGINGAAFAVAVSIVLLFGGGLIQVRKLLGLWPYDRRHIKLFLATVGALIFLLGSKILVDQKDINLFWLGGTTIATFFLFVSLFLYKPDSEDQELLRMFFAKYFHLKLNKF